MSSCPSDKLSKFSRFIRLNKSNSDKNKGHFVESVKHKIDSLFCHEPFWVWSCLAHMMLKYQVWPLTDQ